MVYDVTTIGDAMRDIFIFPNLDDIEKPVSDEEIDATESFEKYLVFGLGDKINISEVHFSIGGTAANVAVGLAKLGLKTSIITAIGSDSAGTEIITRFKEKKVNLENIKIYKNKKSGFSVIVSYKGERTIFVYHGFTPESFVWPEKLKTSWLYLGPMAKGYEKIFNKIVTYIVKNNLKVAINPGSIQINAGLSSFGGLKELIEVIFLNRQEAHKLSGLPKVPTIKDIAKAIHLAGPKIVVITDGKEGAYAYNGIDFYKIGVYPGHRLDATGAGDSFASGFLAGMIKCASLRDCLKWGVINSASVIEKIGAQENLLSPNIIKRRAKEYRWPADTLRFS